MSQPTQEIPDNLKSRLKSSYDSIAHHYNTNFTRSHDSHRTHYLGNLLSHPSFSSKPTASVLELGCGSGIPSFGMLLDLEKPKVSVTGNDLSTTQLDLAWKEFGKYGERLNLIEGDMMSLMFDEGCLDAVVSFYAVIHLPGEEQMVLLERIAKWLKPGGLLLVNFADEESQMAVEEKWLGQEEGWMFWSGWGGEKSVKMVEEMGLEIVVKEVTDDVVDARFVWVLAEKKV